MADSTTPTPKTPWHLWVVGVLYLLWSCAGANDFTMTETHNAAYIKAFPPALMTYVYSLPLWVVIAWGVATWGGVVGSLFLLFRRCPAVSIFLVALIGMILTVVYNYGIADGMKVMGMSGLIFSCVIAAVGFLVWFYARAMRSRGVLR